MELERDAKATRYLRLDGLEARIGPYLKLGPVFAILILRVLPPGAQMPAGLLVMVLVYAWLGLLLAKWRLVARHAGTSPELAEAFAPARRRWETVVTRVSIGFMMMGVGTLALVFTGFAAASISPAIFDRHPEVLPLAIFIAVPFWVGVGILVLVRRAISAS
ncbi:MAG: hypothetical protein WCJ30_01285 [Deltaproteobacteria bacterium]